MKKYAKKDIESILDKYFPTDSLKPEHKKDIIEYTDFRKELTKESDRGCALLAASYLDFILEEMLNYKLVGSQSHLKSLFDFNGPLGTFSSKIKLSYSIGLIAENRMNDLNTIRKIRNEFGHSPSIISFSNQKIGTLCNNLTMVSDPSEKDARTRFISSVSFISGGITALRFDDEKFKEKESVDVPKMQEALVKFMDLLKKELKLE